MVQIVLADNTKYKNEQLDVYIKNTVLSLTDNSTSSAPIGNSDELNTLVKMVSEMKTTVDLLTTRVNTMERNGTSFSKTTDTKISELSAQTGALKTNDVELKKTIDELKSDFETIDTNVVELKQTLDAFKLEFETDA